MMAGTHMAAGLALGYAVSAAQARPWEQAALLAGVGALAALLPDVDHPQSAIRQRAGVPGHLAFFWLKHRGLTHTLPLLALIGALAFALLPEPLGLVVALGYASHLVLDALTRSGVPLLWPLTWRAVKLLPRPLQVRTGSWRESAFLLLLLGGLALLIWRGI